MANIRNREDAHRRFTNGLRETKRIRQTRAEIHQAIEESIRMKRSRKRGTSNLDANMERLGFRRISNIGHVEERFEKIT